jgi:exopolysaccharide biosynthesis WecB/TagA/CpsF family protein
MKKVNMFGVSIDNVTIDEVFSAIDQLIEEDGKGYVVTPNVDHVVKLTKDSLFKEIYDQAFLVLNDSMILKRAGKLLGHPMKEKISGSDLFPLLCEHASHKNYKLFFLGGLEGVAEKAKEELLKKYPTVQVVGTYSPPFGFENDEIELEHMISLINEEKPDILFVGLGAPKQEKFTYRYSGLYTANVTLCIGASFDFQAGSIKRAPRWMQRSGLEWFYRFIKEPKRLFKRYFVDDVHFIGIFVKEWLKMRTK